MRNGGIVGCDGWPLRVWNSFRMRASVRLLTVSELRLAAVLLPEPETSGVSACTWV